MLLFDFPAEKFMSKCTRQLQSVCKTTVDACFANPVIADVMADERKIAGAAQRRTRASLLQQGSIQLQNLGEDFRVCLATAMAEKIFAAEMQPVAVRRAEDLAAQKYATPGWLHRR